MENLPDAWQSLKKSERRAADRMFRQQFSFWDNRDRSGGRTIIEPQNSVTYKFKSMGDFMSEIYKARTLELCKDYVEFFKSVIAEDDFVVVYDPHHPSYKFWPHREFNFENELDWPIAPLPNGDYNAFFPSNFKSCLYGYPWEPSVCVIGNRFIEGIRKRKPRGLGAIIRRSGRPVS